MLNVSIPGSKSGEYLALQLDRAGISLSTKSACDEGKAASHVVEALAVASEASAKEVGPQWRALNTLRFSLGRNTTERECSRLLTAVTALVKGT